MKRILSLAVFAFLTISSQVFAAQATATFGDYNSSNVYRMTADINGVITYANDTGILYPYTTASTNQTLTASQTGTTLVFNNGSGVTQSGTRWTLPTAAVGMRFTFIADVAKSMMVAPQSGDTINFASTAAGYRIQNLSSAAIGDSITLVCNTANTWSIASKVGTWTMGPNN